MGGEIREWRAACRVIEGELPSWCATHMRSLIHCAAALRAEIARLTERLRLEEAGGQDLEFSSGDHRPPLDPLVEKARAALRPAGGECDT